MPELCPRTVSAVILTDCGGGSAEVINKTGKIIIIIINKCPRFHLPFENIPIPSMLVDS